MPKILDLLSDEDVAAHVRKLTRERRVYLDELIRRGYRTRLTDSSRPVCFYDKFEFFCPTEKVI